MKGIFITGTDTDIGKTWVGEQLIKELINKNIHVSPRKPVESGWPETDITQADAWKLANAAGVTDKLQEVCPNQFKAAISPERAAKEEGVTLTLERILKDCLVNTDKDSFLFVEGAGGFYSPLCSNALNANLMVSLNLPIVLIAEDRLGCINQVLLNVEAIEQKGLSLKAIVLNKKIDTKNNLMNNKKDLESLLDYPVIPIGINRNTNAALENLCRLIT